MATFSFDLTTTTTVDVALGATSEARTIGELIDQHISGALQDDARISHVELDIPPEDWAALVFSASGRVAPVKKAR